MQVLSAVLVFLVGSGFPPLTLGTINPCQHRDGSHKSEVDLKFTESYGGTDASHLPTMEQEQSVSSQIQGKVRHTNHTALKKPDTIVLRLWDIDNENSFYNRTTFRPLEVYFRRLTTRSDRAFVSLKQGINREILGNIYTPGEKGVTNGTATMKFHVECIPDNSWYTPQNFTVNVVIMDVNDNRPVFFNTSSDAEIGNVTVFVRQGTPSNTLIFRGLVARDLDESVNAQTRIYSLPNLFFRTAENTSEIQLYTKMQMSYEYFGGQSVTVLVIAVDTPAVPSMVLTSTATITVTLLEEEDLPPNFLIPECVTHRSRCICPTYTAIVVSSYTSSGPLLIQPGPIKAETQDSLAFFRIRYSLLESDHSATFRIDEETGQVTQLGTVEKPVVLVVQATKWTDRSDYPTSGRYSFALLKVSVEPQERNSTQSTTLILCLLSGGTAAFIASALTAAYCQRQRRKQEAGKAGMQPASEQTIGDPNQLARSGQNSEDPQQPAHNYDINPDKKSNHENIVSKQDVMESLHERMPWTTGEQNTAELEEDDST